jgi:hypothetical protein
LPRCPEQVSVVVEICVCVMSSTLGMRGLREE